MNYIVNVVLFVTGPEYHDWLVKAMLENTFFLSHHQGLFLFRSSTTCTENQDEELPKQQMISQAFSASLSLSGTERLSKREDVVSDCVTRSGQSL